MTLSALMQNTKKTIFTLIGLFLIVYVFVMFISHSANDPSWSHISSDMTKVTNMGGVLGAWFSDILFTFFGVSAWWLLPILFYETVLIWWERASQSTWLRVIAYLFIFLTSSALFGQFAVIKKLAELGSTSVQVSQLPSMLSQGGIVGYEFANRFSQIFTQLGALLFFILFLVGVATFAFNIFWQDLFKTIFDFKWLGTGLAKPKQQPEASNIESEDDNNLNNHFIQDDVNQEDVATESLTQLPLDYEKEVDTSSQTEQPESSPNLLSDFLQKTGLATSVLPKVNKTPEVNCVSSEYAPLDSELNSDVFNSANANVSDNAMQTNIEQDPVEPEVLQATTQDSIYETSQVTSNEQSPFAISPSITQPIDDGISQIDEQLAALEPETPATENEAVLPDITDDNAFAGKSRAFQTAKYRDSISTIPELDILDRPDPNRKPSYTKLELQQLSELLTIKLQDFNVKAEVVNAIPGPVVTRFEVELAPGIKASKVVGISRDLARSMSMASLRVVEVIPGKPYIGIEVPNKKREMVRLIELLETDKYRDPKGMISMAMGKDIGGKTIITDLAKAPHMLVAGTTGSGKSVLVNSMLLSMLLKYTSEQLRLILIDPKQLELANYNDIPHLLTPVVTDMTEAAGALSWCVAEMERRYQLMSLLRVRKLDEFNKKVAQAEAAGNPILDPLWRPEGSVSIDKAPKLKPLPMIVIVADEFADMIMQVGKQAEELITRLAQKSRAAGIHLMLATQRPSVDVITGLIKANIPVRAALRVNSKVDSRTILDQGGAEDMLGNGDMLFLGPGQIEPERVHGAFVSDEEVNKVCEAWRERGAPDYITNFSENFQLEQSGSGGTSGGGTSGEDDALYDEVVAFVMETRKVSASSIQRQFSIGYNRAARIVDSMEQNGIVSAMDKGGKRQLLIG